MRQLEVERDQAREEKKITQVCVQIRWFCGEKLNFMIDFLQNLDKTHSQGQLKQVMEKCKLLEEQRFQSTLSVHNSSLSAIEEWVFECFLMRF